MNLDRQMMPSAKVWSYTKELVLLLWVMRASEDLKLGNDMTNFVSLLEDQRPVRTGVEDPLEFHYNRLSKTVLGPKPRQQH